VAACSTHSIDSTHVGAIQYNDAASWNYDSTAEEHYYGFGCTIVSTGTKIPIAAEVTQTKQADQGTAMRVTRDALAIDVPVFAAGRELISLSPRPRHTLTIWSRPLRVSRRCCSACAKRMIHAMAVHAQSVTRQGIQRSALLSPLVELVRTE